MSIQRPHHLLSMDELSITEIEQLLRRAQVRLNQGIQAPSSDLSGAVVANLFFEPSTRTRFSFEMAVKRLGGETLNFAPQTSSLEKGECLEDTVRTLASMGVDAMVLRHGENGVMEKLVRQVNVPLVNAGEGTREHPTQCLLDLLTVGQSFGRLSGLKVAIVGDVVHSRVAGSHLRTWPRLGSEVWLAGPEAWLPADTPSGVMCVSFEQALTADVVMLLRVQRERMAEVEIPRADEYHRCYGLTEARAARLSPHSIILHPSPVNRGVEMAASLIDHPQSRVFQQVTNGVAVRMAVLEEVIKGTVLNSALGEADGRRERNPVEESPAEVEKRGVPA